MKPSESGLTSQNSLQNLQDRLGSGPMEGEPTATVRLPEGTGVLQHLPEDRDLTWSPRRRHQDTGCQETTEVKMANTTLRHTEGFPAYLARWQLRLSGFDLSLVSN